METALKENEKENIKEEKKNKQYFIVKKEHEKPLNYFPEDSKTKRFIILDTETTGFDVISDKLISIDAVEMKNSELTGIQYHAFLNKRNHENKPLLYYLADYNYQREDNIKKSLETFLEFVGDSYIITHNVLFDLKFINNELKKYNLKEIPYSQCICTLKMNLRFQKSNNKVCDLCKKYDIYVDPDDLHQGIVDSIVLARCVSNLLMDDKFYEGNNNNSNFDDDSYNENSYNNKILFDFINANNNFNTNYYNNSNFNENQFDDELTKNSTFIKNEELKKNNFESKKYKSGEIKYNKLQEPEKENYLKENENSNVSKENSKINKLKKKRTIFDELDEKVTNDENKIENNENENISQNKENQSIFNKETKPKIITDKITLNNNITSKIKKCEDIKQKMHDFYVNSNK